MVEQDWRKEAEYPEGNQCAPDWAFLVINDHHWYCMPEELVDHILADHKAHKAVHDAPDDAHE